MFFGFFISPNPNSNGYTTFIESSVVSDKTFDLSFIADNCRVKGNVVFSVFDVEP